MTGTGVLAGIKKDRLGALRLHRLAEFERAFNGYLEGRVPAAMVREWARKMLEVGLPRLK